jgi:uncharacterized membrane protein YuzA (DUF378 family)
MHKLTFILLVIGGLNWLVFGLTGSWDIGALVGGMMSTTARVIYVLVGLSAIWEIFTHKKNCKCCESKMSAPTGGQM